MPLPLRPVVLLLGCLAATAACSDPAPKPDKPAVSKPAAPPAKPQTPVVAAPAVAPAAPSPLAQAVNAAAFDPAATTPEAKQAYLTRAQVLLDRAHFSPGVIDGREGSNLSLAISAFQEARRLTVDGKLSPAVWDALVADAGPALTDYVITPEDVAGPFTPDIPKDDYEAMAKLPALGYGSPLEALAEKFHMDEPLLQALNPGVDFSRAGTTIIVAALGPDGLSGKVARIEIDNARGVLKAYADGDKLLAIYPATVGSTERPAPVGEWAVNTVAPRPTYTYDPSRLTFGKPTGKLTIKAGPNNPVGSTWIDLTKDTYGIHGTPDPKLVNKRASHGCVRLTNWDAAELGAAVQKGAKVVFEGKPVR
ncbi:lipoprotein-anchoring transpeptidase ErfK/SrfK [Caulobacter rhizosphaerae]|uniref:Lipoprotein-anchoring transpeptidase ErfK/SrfK n=1 Tax=Caulobacter rhizosphaerae TaxID=2010972 RepID=A0ABU1N596_9CAUL|nr:L,D-transpeptidase [Caulobacter rhizosphaerae]MDR6533261.1 lipoprotein-anchoring transpeptidase ErfK/SrfK [Caulobacter rhizosphaerae]